MSPEQYLSLKDRIIRLGYAREIDWSEDIKPCLDEWAFTAEFIWVVLNSGMKNQVAQKIRDRIYDALKDGRDISEVFGHKGKVAAIKYVLENQAELFRQYQEADDKLAYLKSLPWIGDITKYHLAKNLGVDTMKPDRHLVRIAKGFDMDPFEMCQKLSEAIGDKVATVDLVIWRAANLGMV